MNRNADAIARLSGEYDAYKKTAIGSSAKKVSARRPTGISRMAEFDSARRLASDLGLKIERQYSFPFRRSVGKMFLYNKFMTLLRIP